MTTQKRVLGHLLICAYTLLMYAGFYATTLIKANGNTFEGMHSLVYLIYALPVLSAVGGILSYKLTERLLVPAVLQLVTGYLICPLLLLLVYEWGIDFGEDVTHIFVAAPIAAVIFVIFSCIAKLVHMLWKKHKPRKNAAQCAKGEDHERI